MAKKKTTLMIDEHLYASVRLEAAKQRKSVSDIVAEATRAYLTPGERGKRVNLPTFPGRLLLPPTVNPHSTSEVLEHLDKTEDPEGRHPRRF